MGAKRESNSKDKILINNNIVMKVNQVQELLIIDCIKYNDYENEKGCYLVSYWIKKTIETQLKLSDLNDPILALVNYGLEINIISFKVYENSK